MSLKPLYITGPYLAGAGPGVIKSYRDYGDWEKTLETRLKGLEGSREVFLRANEAHQGLWALVSKKGSKIEVMQESSEEGWAVWDWFCTAFGYPPSAQLGTLTLEGNRVVDYTITQERITPPLRQAVLATMIAHAALTLYNAHAEEKLEVTCTPENSKELSQLGFKPKGKWALCPMHAQCIRTDPKMAGMFVQLEKGEIKEEDFEHDHPFQFQVMQAGEQMETAYDNVSELLKPWHIVDFKGFHEKGFELKHIKEMPAELPTDQMTHAIASVKAHSTFFDPPGIISAVFSAMTRVLRWLIFW